MNILSTLFDSAASLILPLLFSIAHILWGRFLFSILPLRLPSLFTEKEQIETTLYQANFYFTFGFAVFGLLGQMLALYGFFHPAFVFAYIFTGCLLSVQLLMKEKTLCFSFVKSCLDLIRPTHFIAKIVFAVFLLNVALFYFLTWTAPGTDALAFYLAQAKVIAATHAITPIPSYEMFAQNGLGPEMLMASMFSIGNVISAKNFIWFTFINGLLWMILMTRQIGGSRQFSLISAIMLITSTAFTLIAWDGKTDLFAHSIGLMCVSVCLWPKDQQKNSRFFFLVGILAGLAVLYKLSYLPTLIITLCVLLCAVHFDLIRQKRIQQLFSWALVTGIGMICVLLLNALKNFTLFGEPFAPFYFFQVPIEPFDLDQVWYTLENTRWILKTYPFALTFGQYPMQHGTLSVLWLCLIPLALGMLVLGFKNTPKGQLNFGVWSFVAACMGIITWAILRPSTFAPRYFLFACTATYPFLALSAMQFKNMVSQWSSRRHFEIVLALMCFVLLYNNMKDYKRFAFSGAKFMIQRDDKWEDSIWEILRRANAHRKPGEKIAMFFYYRSAMSPESILCSSNRKDVSDLYRSAVSSNFWTELYKHGYTAMTYDSLSYASILHKDNPEKVRDFLDDPPPPWLKVEKTELDERFRAYLLTPDLSAAPPVEAKPCQLNGAPI